MPDASSISIEGGTAEMHRHVAVRFWRLAAAARTPEVRAELEERARKHDQLASDLFDLSSARTDGDGTEDTR